MGKVIFRRIGGKIVPILSRDNIDHVLPEKVGQSVGNIRFMRAARLSKPTVKNFKSDFILKHESRYMRVFGQETGKLIAALIGKNKKRKP